MEEKNKLKDPVCGREVSDKSPYHVYYGNGTYYFCSAEDKEEFEKEPEKYTKEPAGFTGGSCD
jgi:YHS domain-containing protein